MGGVKEARKSVNMWDVGRERAGRSDMREYCESRLLEACERGRWRLVRGCGVGEVIRPCSWDEFAGGDVGVGDAAGDEDMTVVMAVLVR